MRVMRGFVCSLCLIGLPALAQTPSTTTVTFASSSLSVSATAVNSGGTLTAGGHATSSSSSDTIAYAWTASCAGGLGAGAFATPSASSSSWTAPSNTTTSDQTCTLTLQAKASPSNAAASLSAAVAVHAQSSTTPPTGTGGSGTGGTGTGGSGTGGSGTGGTGSSGTPVPLDVLTSDSIWRTHNTVKPGDTIYVGLHLMPGWTTSGLSFQWSDTCSGGIGNGAFSSATDPSPSWTAPNNTSGSVQSCAFTVKIANSSQSVSLPFTIKVNKANSGGDDDDGKNSTSTSANATPENGWWWAPSVPGIGFSIEVNASGAIFLGAYMYDSSGNPVWYAASLASAASSGVPSGGVFGAGGSSSTPGWSGTLQFYTGGAALGAAYQAPKSSNVGALSLVCSAAQKCSVTLPNATAPLAIERYAFVSGGTSRAIANASSMPQTGWWWNSSASGEGYFLEVQSDSAGNDTSFIAYYLYGSDGNPRWFITDGTISGSGGVFGSGGSATTSANAIQCSGGASLGNLNPAQIQCTAMASGHVQDSFTSATSGSVNYLDDKLTISIQRFTF